MAILTLDDQMTIRPISYNWGRYSVDNSGAMTNFMLALQDVENKYLKDMLGRDLLKDIKDNPDNYTEVLEGGEYETTDGRAIPFEGLKFITAYFIAARYVNIGYKQDSFTGLVSKDHGEAQRTSSAERKEEITTLNNIALSEWAELRTYLDKNADDYELWIKCKKPANRVTPMFSGVRKTYLR